ncbi:MAG: thioredoxin [Oscillospiraceae bacterium]|nr:thioredoxin [Oscillospiraceae bacterium]
MSVKIITEDDFNELVLRSKLPVLVDFYADWCGPCQSLAPVIEEIAEETAGSVSVYKMNIDQNRNFALEHSILSIPTLIIFQNGKTVNTMLGFNEKDKILKALKSAE